MCIDTDTLEINLSCIHYIWIHSVTEAEARSSFQAHCYFVSSPLIAEGLAVREAILLCIEKGHRHVHLETDSINLVKALTTGPPAIEIYGIVEDITCLSAAFDSISFSWIPRNRNRDADALAKQALHNESLVMSPINIGF
uniref:RNase H type-1 domain-containing protein n=1 Tax=Brassica oleracea var. oleracea TaxID=109376 RepID=A0A0D3A5H9_BRAOL